LLLFKYYVWEDTIIIHATFFKPMPSVKETPQETVTKTPTLINTCTILKINGGYGDQP
jgi:hypothetical protein